MYIYGIIDNNLHYQFTRDDAMKNIKTLAGEIGVTKQAIFQKMKKEPLASRLDNLTTRVGGVVYVYPEGEGIIKDQFHKVQQIFAMPRTTNDDVDINAGAMDAAHNSIDVLRQQLDRKDRQLEALNLHISVKIKQIESLSRQIEELTTALAVAQEQTKAAQALHAGDIHREIIDMLIESQKNPQKVGLWKKIRKKQT